MKHRPVYSFLNLILSFALIVQLMGANALAAFGPEGLDGRAYFCVPSGNISDEAVTAAKEINQLIREQTPGGHEKIDHCQFCVTAQSAVLPILSLSSDLCFRAALVTLSVSERGLVPPAQGPPVGLRAPPNNHNI